MTKVLVGGVCLVRIAVTTPPSARAWQRVAEAGGEAVAAKHISDDVYTFRWLVSERANHDRTEGALREGVRHRVAICDRCGCVFNVESEQDEENLP